MGGEREIIYLSLHCHHQNVSYINMGSDESHFNVSLIVTDKVTRQCPQTTTFEEKGEPKRIRTEVSLLTSLGQTGSPKCHNWLRQLYVSENCRLSRRFSLVFKYQQVINHNFIIKPRQVSQASGVRLVSRGISVRILFGSPFCSEVLVCEYCLYCDFVPHN